MSLLRALHFYCAYAKGFTWKVHMQLRIPLEDSIDTFLDFIRNLSSSFDSNYS